MIVTFKHITYRRKITSSKVILCVRHVRRAWTKNVNWLVRCPNKAKAIFKDLGDIMKFCSNDDVTSAIDGFFSKYADKKNFLDSFHKNWISVDKICKCAYSCMYSLFLYLL